MNNYNISTDTTQTPGFESWVVAPSIRIVAINVNSTPTFNAAAQVEQNHMALRASGKDLDGKFAPQDRLVSRKQAMRKLDASSQRLSKAIDAMQMMENW